VLFFSLFKQLLYSREQRKRAQASHEQKPHPWSQWEQRSKWNVNPWKDCDGEVVCVLDNVSKCELSCHLKKNKMRNKNSFSRQEKVSLQQNSCIPWINKLHFASSTSRLTYGEKRLRRVNCERQTDRGVFVSRTEHMAGGGLLGRWSRRWWEQDRERFN
jgi:hypothetical protein